MQIYLPEDFVHNMEDEVQFTYLCNWHNKQYFSKIHGFLWSAIKRNLSHFIFYFSHILYVVMHFLFFVHNLGH